ncbi:MFS transporter [Caulobacter segnis]|uniref:MFS transporter n=1 Tax=Caulobacter segnis TaxID=88688 RepID=UPI00240F9822|nr:MFS transporter [Caulobacter segnis]MDG2520215.1 MFS transporter [Caulobacter segnis]
MTTTGENGAAPKGTPVRHVAAVVAGNALEFYDFLTYAFFAAQIGRTFFPSTDPTSSLLASLATFGAGFLTRPIGALVIGRLADRAGRKPAMLLTFSLMGAAMVGIALTPSFAVIGVAAPVIVIALRLLQGFALGGELGSSTAYLAEAAPPRRRGLYISLQYMGQDVAILIAGCLGVVLSNLMTPADLDAWGWRVAFLAGAVIVPLGLILRRSLEETLNAPEQAPTAVTTGRDYRRVAVLALAILSSATVASYLLSYLTTYANSTLGMPASLAFGATVATGLAGTVFDPVGGALSDRFGRKPVMVGSWTMLTLLVLPVFWLVEQARTPLVLYGGGALLTIAFVIGASAALAGITEALPKRSRAGSLAIIYAVSTAVFGGVTQVSAAWLTKLIGSPMAPAWLMMTASVIALSAALGLRETAPAKAA